MKKENIYVEITNETERLRAIEILQNAGEVITPTCNLLKLIETPFEISFNPIRKEWTVILLIEDETKITLDELESLLNPKKSNVFIDVQEWIRENCPEVLSWVFTQKEEPECFKLLKEHLKNDYPQGTEIKISKDKIEIYHS
jgi:hypothetical protein